MKKQLDLIRKTVQILDSVSYENYSAGKASTYLKYMEGARGDERKLIAPILFPKFVEQILGFKLGDSLWAEEPDRVARGWPDAGQISRL